MKYIGDVDDIASNKWEQHPDNVPCVLSPDPLHKGFIALGENGEYQNVKVDSYFPSPSRKERMKTALFRGFFSLLRYHL